MKRLSIWFTRTHASVDVETDEGVVRATNAKKMEDVLNAMNGEDKEMLVRFCTAVVECAAGNCRRLTEW